MSRSRKTEIRKTPSSLKTMAVSEFVRGGLYDIDESTIVVTHGEPMGMWIPRGQYEALIGVGGTYYASSMSSNSVLAGASSSTSPLRSSTTPTTGHLSFTSDAINASTIERAVEAAVLRATSTLADTTERTITRLMNEHKKGDTTSGE